MEMPLSYCPFLDVLYNLFPYSRRLMPQLHLLIPAENYCSGYSTVQTVTWHETLLLSIKSKLHYFCLAQNLIPRSHSYCLFLPLCLEWYNGSITPRLYMYSGVTKRIQCRLHYRPSATVE